MNQNLIPLAVAQVMPKAIAAGTFISQCSIQAPTPQAGAISGTYAPVSGLQNIPCMDAPEKFGNFIAAVETKDPGGVTSIGVRHVLLNGYYPLLSPATNWGTIGWRAAITEPGGGVVIYDLIGAEQDSQQTQTRLALRVVSR